jgi:hypothetical protein
MNSGERDPGQRKSGPPAGSGRRTRRRGTSGTAPRGPARQPPSARHPTSLKPGRRVDPWPQSPSVLGEAVGKTWALLAMNPDVKRTPVLSVIITPPRAFNHGAGCDNAGTPHVTPADPDTGQAVDLKNPLTESDAGRTPGPGGFPKGKGPGRRRGTRAPGPAVSVAEIGGQGGSSATRSASAHSARLNRRSSPTDLTGRWRPA